MSLARAVENSFSVSYKLSCEGYRHASKNAVDDRETRAFPCLPNYKSKEQSICVATNAVLRIGMEHASVRSAVHP